MSLPGPEYLHIINDYHLSDDCESLRREQKAPCVYCLDREAVCISASIMKLLQTIFILNSSVCMHLN